MKRLKLTKIIASSLILALVLASNPLSASAVWIDNPSGWWYTEGDSFATGWRLIDSKWYYFDSKGYMVTNTTVDGYYLNIDGVWSELTTSGDFKFDKSTGTIIDYIDSDNSVVIPSKLDGNDVKHISFISSPTLKSLTSITLPDSITNIETMQFKGYRNLKNIIIPNGLTTIGYQAFGGCSLTNIIIPDSVTDIRSEAFLECSDLTSITLPNGLTTIEDGLFFDCSGLTSITIPNSVTTIEYDAFYGCSKLTSITIPNSVTSIGCSAFAKCSSLKSITIPNGVTTISQDTFSGCSSLKSITIPDSVTSIGTAFGGPGPVDKENLAFSNCTNAKFYVTSEAVKQLLINYGISESKIILNAKS